MDHKETYSEIEKQLLKEGFVTSEDIETAHGVREQDLTRAQKPLGFIVADQGQLCQERLQELLDHSDLQDSITTRALEGDLITPDQLAECETLADDGKAPVATVLVEKGYLSDADREKFMNDRLDDMDFVKQAIRDNLVGEKDLECALKLKTYQKSSCEILYERNLITLSELNHVFRKLSRDLKLGQILLQENLVTDSQLQEALAEQANTGQSLGKILLRNRWVSIEQLYFALSIQYNTPFQKLDGYVYYEKQKVALRDIVGQQYATENRIVPLFQNANNLTLAVSNPANIWSMHGLKSMYPELQMTCVLITDEKFEQLYALLYGEVLAPRKDLARRSTAPSPPDGTTEISNPEAEIPLIKKMYEDYRYYQEKAGVPPNESEEGLFFEFIGDSYHKICDKYGCDRVRYRFDVSEERTEILASPVS